MVDPAGIVILCQRCVVRALATVYVYAGVDELLLTNAPLEPAYCVAVVPQYHNAEFEGFTAVQLFRGNVVPVSKPPSPVGDNMVVVVWALPAKARKQKASNEYIFFIKNILKNSIKCFDVVYMFD